MTLQREKLIQARDLLRITMSGTHTRDDVEYEQNVREATTSAVRAILDALLNGESAGREEMKT